MKKHMLRNTLSAAVILLFISVSAIPSTGTTTEKSTLSFDGKTLYVGGSGEGNHSKIQDAIDNASKGDTVYVYNGTYYEQVAVRKSIHLIGEYRDTTTIDGEGGWSCTILADVSISGFTIKNSGSDMGFGIVIESNHNTITGNNIVGNLYGIFFSTLPLKNNNISDNIISSNRFGINLWEDYNNTISSNTITNNIGYGILLQYADENEISRNSIFGNYGGISLEYSQHNVIIGNTIKNNELGIELFDSCGNLISRNNIANNQLGIKLIDHSFGIVKENNFIENDQNVDYNYFLNRWIRNYWDDWDSLLPRPIKSKCTFVTLSYLLSNMLKRQVEISIPWVQFDWHPANEPYDI